MSTSSSSSGIAIELAGDSPTGSDRTLSAHDSGDVTPKAENGHAKAAANKAAKAAKAGHGSPPAVAVGAHGGDGSATPQQLPSQPSSPAKFKSKPLGTIGVPETSIPSQSPVPTPSPNASLSKLFGNVDLKNKSRWHY